MLHIAAYFWKESQKELDKLIFLKITTLHYLPFLSDEKQIIDLFSVGSKSWKY